MINDLGLILNVIGTLLIAFSVSPFNKKEFGAGGYTFDDNGNKKEIAYFSPKFFKYGIFLILIGFLIQLSFIKGMFT